MLDDVARWYLVTALVGVGGTLPVASAFGPLNSRGALFGRPFGALVVGYGAWILGATSPLGYGTGAVLGGLVALFAWSALLLWRQPALLRGLRERWRLALIGEGVFALVFAIVVLGRSLAPAAVNTEKPMDMMILVAVHEAEGMPPEDSWFAGRPLSYYHLGHTTVDALARLSGVSSGVAFNLGLAGAGAMAAAAAFALAGDVHGLTTRRPPRTWVAGGVAVGALVVLASLEGGLELVAANVGGDLWRVVGVPGFPSSAGTAFGVPTDFWWWWRATRVLPDAISEFPAFSLILGDMHAHVLGLPLAILALALALTAFEGSRPQTLLVWARRPGELAVASLLFAGVAMTNAWDAPLYGLIWLGAGVLAYASSGWGFVGSIMGMVRHLVPPAAIAALLAWPMFTVFDHVPLGVAPVLTSGSDPARFLLVWGPFVVILGVCALVTRPRVDREVATLTAIYASAFVLAWALAVGTSGRGAALAERGWGWVTLVALVGVTAWALGATLAATRAGDRGRGAWLALVAGATLLVLGTEVAHLVDALPGRFNTVFKFWYGAWIMLAIASGGAVADALTVVPARTPSLARQIAGWGALAVVAVCALYTPAALLSRGSEGQRTGLDALAFLADDGADEAATAEWARGLDRDAVLLEAPGKSYQSGSRVSLASGVPTVLGWSGHEVTWRGDGAGVGAREDDVSKLYNEGANEAGLAVARRYGVTHVYLGARERERYGAAVGTRFSGWSVAFETPGARVVLVPAETQVAPRPEARP